MFSYCRGYALVAYGGEVSFIAYGFVYFVSGGVIYFDHITRSPTAGGLVDHLAAEEFT